MESNYRVQIPVTYYPPGNLGDLKTDAEGAFELPANEVALVLVDTWNSGDPEEGQEPSQSLKDIQTFLHTCREHNLTIIHAPNHPVVDKYPQYHTIKQTVQNYTANYPTQTKRPPHLDWPPRDNDVLAHAKTLRTNSPNRAQKNAQNMKERDISRFLLPLEKEHVLATHDEFRYVLWKKGIKLLHYVGGALNECMQHRDTGINFLVGMDSRQTGFTLVVLEDCSTAKPTPKLGERDMAHAMLEYFKCKITFTANSKNITFST